MDDFEVVKCPVQTLKKSSTLEIAKEFVDRVRGQVGVNELPQSLIHDIMNYLEAEAINRSIPMLEREY